MLELPDDFDLSEALISRLKELIMAEGEGNANSEHSREESDVQGTKSGQSGNTTSSEGSTTDAGGGSGSGGIVTPTVTIIEPTHSTTAPTIPERPGDPADFTSNTVPSKKRERTKFKRIWCKIGG